MTPDEAPDWYVDAKERGAAKTPEELEAEKMRAWAAGKTVQQGFQTPEAAAEAAKTIQAVQEQAKAERQAGRPESLLVGAGTMEVANAAVHDPHDQRAMLGDAAPAVEEKPKGFTNERGGSGGLSGATQTKKNAFNPGDMAKLNAPGERERYAEERARKSALMGAVDAEGDPLPRRALRTDDEGWSGASQTESGAPGRTGWPYQGKKGADAVLVESLDPRLTLMGDSEEARAEFEKVEVVDPLVKGLTEKFVVPPFTVLDTRQSYWQDRRRLWLGLGLRGETTTEKPYSPGHGQQAPSGVYGGAGGAPAPLKKDALNTSADDHLRHGQGEAKNFAGRKQGLIYDHSAPASDPSFYSKKTAVERQIGRTLTTEEFKRDFYSREEQDFGQSASVATGTSVFDPVLCEIAYRWFCGEGGQVVDPFAGGAVRGVLAGALGRRYAGVELRPEQVADNRLQADSLFAEDGPDFGRETHKPVWTEGDATLLDEHGLPAADLVFTCPPYADLEVYSDDPRDLSTMPYAKFIEMYRVVMQKSAALLKPNRFAVWVVGEARDKKTGHEYGFVPDTIKAAQEAGLGIYNSAILVNSVGSAALRAQMILRSRKLTRVHQHVLVFVKGDAKKAAAACGTAELES